MRRILVTTTAVLAVLALTAAAAQAAGAPTAGSPGIGDPYFPDYGNGGYDVGHYGIDLRYRPDTDQLTGTTTIRATATQALRRFDLDFVLDVSAVRVNDRPARFSRQGDHELVVTPARPLRYGEPMTVVVRYSGVPSQVKAEGITPWVHTPDGALAEGAPEIAWWWFPSNDHPRDKATYDISVRVPAGTSVISNGRPTAHRPAGPGWTAWSYRESQPMATYLAFVDIGQFDIGYGTSANGQPIITAYSTNLDQATRDAASADVGRTDEVLNWESSLFGPYPFDARGAVVVPNFSLGFALENQTRPVYDGAFWATGDAMYVVVHENAHQWYGDSVSVHNWRDVWLNEGFASYAEWLWSEAQGQGTAEQLAQFYYQQYPADDPFWTLPIGDPGAADMWDFPVYARGAMALQALRDQVGDHAFFATLRAWATQHRYGNGEIAQFEALAERISGQDLSGLFTAWLYTPSRPAFGTFARAARVAAPRSYAAIQQSYQDVR